MLFSPKDVTPTAEIAYKVKVKLPCALTEHHAIKAYWGVEV
jgi:hypothetical protein